MLEIPDNADRIILKQGPGLLGTFITDDPARARRFLSLIPGQWRVEAHLGIACIHVSHTSNWQLWDDGSATRGTWIDRGTNSPQGLPPAADKALSLVFGAANRAEDWGDRATWHPLRVVTGHQAVTESEHTYSPRVHTPHGSTESTTRISHWLIRHTFTGPTGPVVLWEQGQAAYNPNDDDPFSEYRLLRQPPPGHPRTRAATS